MAHVPVHSSVLPMLFGCLLLLAGYSYGLRAVVVPSANQMRQYFTESYIRMADRAVAARPSILVLVDSCSQRFGMPGFSRLVQILVGSFLDVCLPHKRAAIRDTNYSLLNPKYSAACGDTVTEQFTVAAPGCDELFHCVS